MFDQFRQILTGSDKEKSASVDRRRREDIHDEAFTDIIKFRRALEIPKGAVGKGNIPLGRCRDHRGDQFWVGLPTDDLARSRAWITGASGTGKSVWLLSLIMAYLRAPRRGAFILVDCKGELADWLLQTWLPLLAHEMPTRAREEFLGRLVIVNPFGQYLPGLNITLRDRSVPIELQAFDVANTISECFGSQGHFGIRMDTIMKFLLRLAIEHQVPFPQLRDLLAGGPLLADLVRRTRDQELRQYFALRFHKEPQATIQAVASRLDNLLLLPDNRLVLSSRSMLAFGELLEGNSVVIVNLGAPPMGLEPLARFWGSLLVTKLARAIMSRKVTARTRPALVALDEFQIALNASQAEQWERLLTQSRFMRVGLWMACQQVTQIAKVSHALVSIMETNTTLQACFRSDEADHLAQAMPVTGLRPKPGQKFLAPGERPQYCSPAEERKLLLEETARLPERLFWLHLKGKHQAQLLRTPTVDLDGAARKVRQVPDALLAQIQRGTDANTREEIRRIKGESAERPRFAVLGRANRSVPPSDSRPEGGRGTDGSASMPAGNQPSSIAESSSTDAQTGIAGNGTRTRTEGRNGSGGGLPNLG